MPSGQVLIEQLARDHADHLRWLCRRTHGRLSPDEAEDILQAAYAKALRILDRPDGPAMPRFDTVDQARAWLRRIAVNLAVDDDRHRHGRGAARHALPRRPSLASDRELPRLDAGVDVEADALRGVERERQRVVIARALAALAPEHRQVLHLRYARSLDPAAIMLLENITRRQWDGRHTRALKAFAGALSRLHVSAECRQTRRLLRHSPATLLQRGRSGAAGAHIDGCVACGAFARSTHAALAGLPLPMAIDEWRYQLLDYFGGGRPTTAPRVCSDGQVAGSATAHAGKLAAMLTATAVAVAGVTAFDRGGRTTTGARAERPAAPQALKRTAGTEWAHHATERQALEQAAEALEHRAEARSAGVAAPAGWRHRSRWRRDRNQDARRARHLP